MKLFVTYSKKYENKIMGFTLMEILVALAILGGAAFVLFNVYYNAMKLHQITIDQTDENQLLYAACSNAEVGVLTGELEGGGDFGTVYEGYTWNYIASAIGSDSSIPLYSVNVTLNTPENDTKNLTFLCYDLSVESQGNELTGNSNQAGNGGTTRTNTSTTSSSGFSSRGNTMFGR